MINRNFTLLWIGKIISQLGDKFYAIALAWWILQKTNSPSIMGLFLFTVVFPGVLLGFFAGALVDRWKRKNILIIADIIRGGLVLLISFLAINNSLETWQVFVIAFCLSIATAFFDPAIQAILPEIVEKESLPKANGMSQMVGGICTVAGPLLGAISVSLFGIAWVFLANSVSYFISAILASFIEMKKDYRNFDEKRYLWKDICEGVHFLKNQRRITLVLKIIAIAHFFLGSLMVSLPFLAKLLQGNGINNLGVLEMMLGVGMIGASLFLSIVNKAYINERKLIIAILLMGISFLLISTALFLGLNILYAYITEMCVIGACIACASVFWQWLLQSYTPDYMTGRVFSISSLIGNISLPIAYGIFGALLGISSIFKVIAGCGMCLIVLCGYLILRDDKIGDSPGKCD